MVAMSTTPETDELRNYLEKCKTNLRVAHLGRFIKTFPQYVIARSQTLDVSKADNHWRRKFIDLGKKIGLSNDLIVADTKKVNWKSIITRAQELTHEYEEFEDLPAEEFPKNSDILEPLRTYANSSKNRDRVFPPSQSPDEAEGFIRVLYYYCIELLRSEKITPVKQSYLHTGLYGIINAVNGDEHLKKHIGKELFEMLERSCLINMTEERLGESEDEVVEKLKSVYEDDGMLGVRRHILEKKIELIDEGVYNKGSVELQIYDIMDILMNMVQFNKNIKNRSETESLTAWYNVLNVLFRDTDIELRIGDNISESSKSERRENELVECGSSGGVFGMKIDMLVKAYFNESLQSVELAANGFKRESISVDDGIMQLNRNLRSNAYILSELVKRFELQETNSYQLDPIIIDAIGYSGYFYKLYRYNNAFVGAKLLDETVTLPRTHVEFAKFLETNMLKILLYYKNYFVQSTRTVPHLIDGLDKRKTNLIANISDRSLKVPRVHFPKK